MSNEDVKICTAQDNLEAEMIIAALKNSHIPAYKKDRGMAGLMNIYSGNSSLGEDIYVADSAVEEALEVLRGMGLA